MNLMFNVETDRDKRVAQILATDVTREQLADVVWCCEEVIRRRDETENALYTRIDELNERVEEMVEVVRCRDCEWGWQADGHYTCWLRSMSAHYVDGDGYCSDGEREREEDE